MASSTSPANIGASPATGAEPVARGVAVCVLPVLMSLYVAATTFSGGTFWPWKPIMVDLDVYRRAGSVLLAGGNFYLLPGPLQFLYPPFAAVLAVPMAVLPLTVVQIGWTAAGALALLAVLHRFGLTGWPLSLIGTAVIYFVEPVVQTLAFGQLGIFLVALVVLDLAPGPRTFRRLLPQGTLTAVAAAIKLTPAIFVVYLLAVGRIRAFVVAVVVGLAVTLISAAVVPQASYEFWSRLAHGDTGLGHSLIYWVNQSVMADVVRIFGLGRSVAIGGLIACAIVALIGVWAAVLWHRIGDIRLAVNLCGLAGLLASPVSWQHHFVWIVPLAMSLAEHRRGAGGAPRLPGWFLALGWVFVGWVVATTSAISGVARSPFRRLPNGADMELDWNWSQNLRASVTAILGLIIIIGAIAIAQHHHPSRRRPAGASGLRADEPDRHGSPPQ
jgi:alpha-1,2-mannosyltransferase